MRIMDLKYVRSELRKLSEIVEGWNATQEIGSLERDLALDKLRTLYEAVRFGTEEAPAAADAVRQEAFPTEIPVSLDLGEVLSIEPLPVAEQWVRTWGETVNKKTAAKMLGVSISQVNRLIANGDLVTTTSEDGRSRVIVRAAAEYVAMASRRIKPAPKVPMTRKGNPIRFIP